MQLTKMHRASVLRYHWFIAEICIPIELKWPSDTLSRPLEYLNEAFFMTRYGHFVRDWSWKAKKKTYRTFWINKKNIIDFKTIFETNDVEAQNIDK